LAGEEEEEIAADSIEDWGEGPPLENGEHELGAVVAVAESTFASAQDLAFAELTNEMAEGEAAVELAHAVVARLAFADGSGSRGFASSQVCVVYVCAIR
jgi:hypothetical protein